jgi:hypothetical protein
MQVDGYTVWIMESEVWITPRLLDTHGQSEDVSSITTSEAKTGALLIETFWKLFNAYENGHLATGGHLLFVR